MIKWDNKSFANISMNDEDNKKFIDIINKATRIQKYSNKRPSAISEILIDITTYARKHFRTEETNMINSKYSYYKSHKDEHNSFYDRIQNFWQELAENNFKVINAILEHLNWWLTNHIQGTDKKYAVCFSKNSLK